MKLKYGTELSKNRFFSWIKTHPFYVFLSMIFVTTIVIYWDYLLGNRFLAYYDIGSDTIFQYIPVYSALVNKLKDLDFSLWEMNYGFGADLLCRKGDWFDVFTIPIVLAGYFWGNRAMLYVITFVQISKSVLSGVVCYKFLDLFDFSNLSRITASYIFAFNGFIMLWGQHYFFATTNLFFVIILYLIELSLRNKKYFLHLTLAITIVMSFSDYLAYMIAAGAFYYVILRIIMNMHNKGIKGSFELLGHYFFAAMIGSMISAVFSIPQAYQIVGVSPRMEESNSLFYRIVDSFHHIRAPWEYKMILFRFLSNNLSGTAEIFNGITNYYEMENLFFSSLIIIILAGFFAEEIMWGNRRLFYFINLLILGASFVLPVFHLYFNMFSEEYTRYSFVYMPIFAIVTASVISNIKHYHYSSLSVMAITAFAFVYLLIFKNENYTKKHHLDIYIFLICFIMVAFVIISLICRIKNGIMIAEAVSIIALIMISTTLDSYYTTNVRNPADKTSMLYKEGFADSDSLNSLECIINKEGKKELYRVEKDYKDASWINDALNMDFSGISQYNSITNHYVQIFLVEVWPEVIWFPDNSIYIECAKDCSNDRMLSLFGIRYIISKKADYPQYSVIDGNNAIRVYQNDKAGGIGIFFDSIISENLFMEYSDQDQQKILGNSVVLPDIPDTLTDNEFNGEIDNDYHFSENSVYFRRIDNDGHIIAEVDNSKDNRILFVSIPYDIGWKAYIDGIDTDIIRANIGFQALIVPKGHHVIEMRYHSPWMSAGMAISVIGIILLCINVFIIKPVKTEKILTMES